MKMREEDKREQGDGEERGQVEGEITFTSHLCQALNTNHLEQRQMR